MGVISTAKYFAPRALAIFSKEHPGVDVRLMVGNRDMVLTALRDFTIDFAVAGRPPEDMAIDRAAIGNNPHIIIGPPDHPLAGRRRIPLARFAGETFLLREEGSGTRMLMERLFAESGLSPNIGMEIGSNETIKQAVMAGLGVALISAHTVAAELEDGRLISFDVPGLPIVRQWFVTSGRSDSCCRRRRRCGLSSRSAAANTCRRWPGLARQFRRPAARRPDHEGRLTDSLEEIVIANRILVRALAGRAGVADAGVPAARNGRRLPIPLVAHLVVAFAETFLGADRGADAFLARRIAEDGHVVTLVAGTLNGKRPGHRLDRNLIEIDRACRGISRLGHARRLARSFA